LGSFGVAGKVRWLADEDQLEDIAEDERRIFDRSRLIIDVYFDGADFTGVASTKDISLGGLYLSTQTGIPEGSTLTMRIPLGGQQVVVRGDVVYSNPGHGVGVRFHRLSNEKRSLMERELPAP
jgi:PilZ domain